MMRAARLTINVLLLVLPLVLLIWGASRYVRGVFDYLNTDARLAGTLSAEATRLLGREVRVGDVHITGNLWSLDAKNSVELKEVAVAENTTLDRGVFAKADRVVVDYSIRQIVLEKDKRVPLINNLRVERPFVLLVRNARGEWNFQKLLKPGGAPSRPLLDRIKFTAGTLLYRDALFPAPDGIPQRPLNTQLANLTGILLLRDSKSAAFDVAGTGPPGWMTDFHAVGAGALAPNQLTARVTAHGLNLPVLAGRFVPAKQVQVGRGMADTDLSVTYIAPADPKAKFSIDQVDAHGTLAAQNVDALAPQLKTPVRNANISAAFTRNLVKANVIAQAAGSTLNVNGVTALTWKPKLNITAYALQGNIQNADIARIRREFDIEKRLAPQFAKLTADQRRIVRTVSGQGDIGFHIAGDRANPTGDLALKMRQLTASGYGVKNLALNADFDGKTVNADLTAGVGKGALVVRGQAEATGKRAFRVEGRARDLNLSFLRLPKNQALAGNAKLDFAASGEQGTTPRLQARVNVNNARYAGQALRSVYAVAETVGNRLALRTVRIEDPKGFALASGTVDLKTRQLDIRIGANELDLSRLKTALQTVNPKALKGRGGEGEKGRKGEKNSIANASFDLSGTGYLRGKITGTIDKPRLLAQANLFAIESGDYGLDRVTASVDLTKDALIIAQGSASRYPGTIRFSGLIADPLKPDPELSLNASVDNLDLTDLARLAGVDPDTLLITGSLSTEEEIQVEGTTGALRVRRPIQVRLDDASINGLPLRNAAAEATYDGKTATIRAAGVNVAGGRITASGTVGKDGALDVQVKGETLGLEDLAYALPLNIADIKKVQGTVDFQADVTGTAKKPQAVVTLTGNGLIYNTFALGTLEAKANYDGSEIKVPSVTLLSPVRTDGKRGEVTVTDAEYNLDTKQIAGAIRWKELSIDRLRELYANSKFAVTDAGKQGLDALNQFASQIDGTLSGSAVVGGTASNPEATVTWDARNVKAGRYAFTSLTGSAKGSLADGKFEKLVVPAPSLPDRILHLEFPAGIVEADNISVVAGRAITGDLRANNVDLALLKEWFPAGSPVEKLSGTGDVFITASGTTDAPVLQVNTINLQNVGYQIQGSIVTIDRIEVLNALVTEGKIQADTIRVSKTDRDRGIKYQAQASGTVGFTFKPPFIPPDAALNFSAVLPDQDIRALVAPANPNIPNASQGTFSLTAIVSGTRSAPDVFGYVTVDAPRLQFGQYSTGLRDVHGKFNLTRNELVVADGFQAYSQIYRNGEPVPDKSKQDKSKEEDKRIVLTGSLPLGLGDEGASGKIALSVKRFVFDENSVLQLPKGTASGQANIDLQLTGNLLAPKLAGDVVVSDSQFALPSEFVGLGKGGLPLPIAPSLDITVRLADKVRLKNAQLNARTDGDIRLFGTAPDYQVRGKVYLREGTLDLKTKRFKIVPTGEVTIVYPTYEQGLIGVPNPNATPDSNSLLPTLGLNVNLKAQTNISARSINNTQRNYTITVTVTGPLTGNAVDPVTGRSRLALNFQSNPPDFAGSQEQMFQKLAGVLGVDSIAELSRNPSQAFASQLTNIFTSSVLPGLFDRVAEASGFETLAIGYDPIQRLNFTISRQLFGPFYATYNRSLSGATEQYTLRLSARFRERYQLSYEVNERNEQRYLLEGIWRF